MTVTAQTTAVTDGEITVKDSALIIVMENTQCGGFGNHTKT